MNILTVSSSILRTFGLRILFMFLTLALPLSTYAQTAYYAGSFKQQRPFLFEIEKDGKVSHILGSMHAGIPLDSYPEVVFELDSQGIQSA